MIRSNSGSRGAADRIRLAIRRHRRPLAVGMLALAVLCAFRALQPPPAATTTIVVAASDLPPGHLIERSDITTTGWPAGVANGSALTNTDVAVGRITSGPIARGEPIGVSRIVGPGLLELATNSATPTAGAGSGSTVAA
ncbi:MAG: SAF domain-containing protein, partial [Actinomycetes bacterium]